jgi:hypothetical protein
MHYLDHPPDMRILPNHEEYYANVSDYYNTAECSGSGTGSVQPREHN